MTSVASPEQRPDSRTTKVAASELPAWPVVTQFVLYPLWWVLGLADLIWIVMALPMVLFMVRSRSIEAPKGFGIYLLFLVWVLLSGTQLERGGQAIGFTYRFLLYLCGAVMFVYAYNARRRLTDQLFTGALVGYWLATILGGYIALIQPGAVMRTPLSYVLPGGLLNNELVNHMVVRRMTQWNPDAWVQLDPRPSAPFLYTNNWGNVYSLLMPFVVAYLFHVRGTKKFWFVLAMIPISLYPAFMTLNRGMFLGLGVAIAYACVRLVLMKNIKAVAAIGLVTLMGVAAFFVLPAQERLEHRVTESSSTEDRGTLYIESLDTIPSSPILGHAVPQQPANPNLDPVGTQGQFWMILVSHGLGAILLFIAWFLTAFALSLRRTDPTGLAASAVLLVGVMELFYYGALPYGLPILMSAAALALRGPVVPSAGGRRALRGGEPVRSRSERPPASTTRTANEGAVRTTPRPGVRSRLQ